MIFMPLEPETDADSKIVQLITKSDRVVLMRSDRGAITGSVHKCFNALLFHLQNYVTERYGDNEVIESALGESILQISIPWPDFCDTMGWKSSNRNNAKKVIQALKKAQVEWGMSDEVDSIGFQQLISGANVNEGFLNVRIDPVVRRELINFKGFDEITFNLGVTNIWSDKYTPRMYELCMRNWRDGVRNAAYSIDNMRTNLDLTYDIGDGGEKVWVYGEFKKFKSRVLQPSIDNLNKSDFVEFDVFMAVRGRPVHTILLSLTRKRKIEKVESIALEKRVRANLSDLGLATVAQEYYNSKYNDDAYFDNKMSEEELHYLEFNCQRFIKYKAGHKSNPGSYFTKMLNDNRTAFESIWAQIQKDYLEKRQREEMSRREKEQRKRNVYKKIASEVTQEFTKKAVKNYLNSKTEAERQAIFELAAKAQNKQNPSAAFKKLPEQAKEAIVRLYILNTHSDEFIDEKELKRSISKAQEAVNID